MTSADYDNDGYKDVIMGGIQGHVRLLVNNHILACHHKTEGYVLV